MATSLLERGFMLGQLHAAGETITTALIRKRFGVSRATAKRDLRYIRAILDDAPRPATSPPTRKFGSAGDGPPRLVLGVMIR